MPAKIVVVDDDPVIRKWAIRTLSEAGYQIIECEEGRAALACVRDHKPDLILMDVEMPGMNGREACRIIKGNKSFGFVPIILMTARDDVHSMVEGLQLGADDYLIKPLNPLELEARVKSMLRLKALQDELLHTNKRLTDMNEHLQELSITDPLTGIHNRLYFQKRVAYEFQRAHRYNKSLSLLVMDLDHFKKVNDTYGHPVGDYVLRQTAIVMQDSIRKVDIIARYGGEEFVVILPETNLEQARLVAERIRKNVENARYKYDQVNLRVTISIGISVQPDEYIQRVEELLAFADEALYLAKQAGRNCIRIHERDQPPTQQPDSAPGPS